MIMWKRLKWTDVLVLRLEIISSTMYFVSEHFHLCTSLYSGFFHLMDYFIQYMKRAGTGPRMD